MSLPALGLFDRKDDASIVIVLASCRDRFGGVGYYLVTIAKLMDAALALSIRLRCAVRRRNLQ